MGLKTQLLFCPATPSFRVIESNRESLLVCPRRATQQTLKHMAECNPTARPPRSIGEGMVPTGLANLRPAGSTSPRGIGKKFGKTASNRREMTAEMLLESCTNNDGYDLPSYNTELYLQYHMIPKITNLEPYTHLRVLYLEHNNLSRISGLSHLSHLRSLYLQNNQIQRIEGLDKLEMLDTLNLCVLPCANCSCGHLQPIAARRLGLVRVLPPFPLALPARALPQRPVFSHLLFFRPHPPRRSNNRISRLEGLSRLPNLRSLMLANNGIEDVEGNLAHLISCTAITMLDLTKNDFNEPEEVVSVLLRCHIGVLYMTKNPVADRITQYRKTFIARMPWLNYLDDKPVFDPDRIAAEAWYRGGVPAEVAVRGKIADDRRKMEKRNNANMRKIQAAARERRRVREEGEAEEAAAQSAIHAANGTVALTTKASTAGSAAGGGDEDTSVPDIDPDAVTKFLSRPGSVRAVLSEEEALRVERAKYLTPQECAKFDVNVQGSVTRQAMLDKQVNDQFHTRAGMRREMPRDLYKKVCSSSTVCIPQMFACLNCLPASTVCIPKLTVTFTISCACPTRGRGTGGGGVYLRLTLTT